MEKVHSAVIGWMLSDKCDAFGTETKGRRIRSDLLQKIFGFKEDFEEFDQIDSYVEWKNIDILVVTVKGKEKKCWVIENKIKSSQHSNQLDRYVEIIRQSFPRCEQKYCFLTLINEEPQVGDNVRWESCTYSQLKDYVVLPLDCQKNKDYPFVVEYKECVSRLSSALSEFINNPQGYRNVFEDGSKKKESKSSKGMGETAKYICDNGLETIFQKCFLSHIVPEEIKKRDSYRIGETFGTALVEYHYAESKEAVLAFQFQNGTFKIQVSRPNPKKRDNSAETSFQTTWGGILKQYCQDGWSLNHQKKNNPPYYSLSSSLVFWSNTDHSAEIDWFDKDIGFIKKQWATAHAKCEEILKILAGKL